MREALKLALQHIEGNYTVSDEDAIAAIKEALAQPEQEPVAMTITGKLGNIYSFTGDYSLKKGDKIYTAPPQRTWVGLTPQERDEINEQVYGAVPHHVAFHHAIEQALKEKNT